MIKPDVAPRVDALSPFDPSLDSVWIARFQHFVEIDVRYCETDGAQHVNHVSVPAYLEHGLLNYLSAIGDPESSSRFSFEHVTAELLVRYLESSAFGEKLRVGSQLVHVGRRSLAVEQVLLSEDGSIRAVSRSVIVRTQCGQALQWTDAQRATLLAQVL